MAVFLMFLAFLECSIVAGLCVPTCVPGAGRDGALFELVLRARHLPVPRRLHELVGVCVWEGGGGEGAGGRAG